MRSIIIGNGINIQFGGAENTNKSIIDRALTTVTERSFDPRVYGEEAGIWVNLLFNTLPEFISGRFDAYATLKGELDSLNQIKKDTRMLCILVKLVLRIITF